MWARAAMPRRGAEVAGSQCLGRQAPTPALKGAVCPQASSTQRYRPLLAAQRRALNWRGPDSAPRESYLLRALFKDRDAPPLTGSKTRARSASLTGSPTVSE